MNLTLFYVIAFMILTPIVLEWINKQPSSANNIVNKIYGLPAFTVNLVVCVLFGFLVCVIPFGAKFTITNFVVYTALIFLGNQIVYQYAVKLLARYRSR